MPEVFNSPKNSTQPSDKRKDSDSDQEKQHRNVDEYSAIMRHEKPSRGYFKAFLAKPQKTKFDTQVSGEHIILLLRKHPITQWKVFVIVAAAILLPLFTEGSFFSDFLPSAYIAAINLSWYLLVFSYALSSFLIWFFSVYIITDERIIDVDFVSLLFKDVSSAKIDAVQDISSETGGFLASIVDYGTVYIQTAGEQREIEFESVPQPAKVAALLNELIIEEEREKTEGRVR